MRVISSESSNPSACGTYSWGETEDYNIDIISYCASGASTTFDTKIDSVGLNTITQSSLPTACEDYTDYTAVTTDLSVGNVYTIAVKNGSCGGYYGSNKGAWIDYNQNGIYEDPAERIMDTSSTSALQTQSVSFTVPGTATLGITRMRVVIK